jgi:3-deoxy-D-manno-octulosonate 8-phosphate phosphatase (KDO 8-P phosphatase)
MKAINNDNKPDTFILDVDGVMTTGQFIYSAEGKVMKVFGPDDNDGLSLLKRFLTVRFITGDLKGFPISKKRIVDDMGYPLDLVSTTKRIQWMRENYDLAKVIYMGDGIFDGWVMRQVAYGIAPRDADPITASLAQYVTSRKAGHRAVAEASIHILEKFFEPFDHGFEINDEKMRGDWAV